MTKKVVVSAILEPEVAERLTELQAKTRIFSRSKLLRDVIEKGLQVLENNKR